MVGVGTQWTCTYAFGEHQFPDDTYGTYVDSSTCTLATLATTTDSTAVNYSDWIFVNVIIIGILSCLILLI